MNSALTDDRISKLADMVRQNYGLDFSMERWNDLRSAVVRFHNENKFFSTAAESLDYIISPEARSQDIEQFINSLTIGETFFFRDTKALKALEYEILRKLNGKGRGINGAIRIWSTACATGEEPYTLAMICRRSGLTAEIFGTDIDSRALIKAREGCYRRWSFRSEDKGFRDVFFRKVGANSYLIDSTIKNMVNLSRLNLMDASVPASLADMDVVLCRNVLMYFSPKGVQGVLDKLWDCLSPGGWLIVTPSESALLTSHGRFEPVNITDVLFFRKNEHYKPKALAFSADFSLDAQDSPMPFSDCPPAADLPSGNTFSTECTEGGEPDPGVAPVDIATSITTTEAADGSRLLEQAHLLRGKGDLSGAEEVYKKLIDQDYSRRVCLPALLGIAELKVDSGFTDEARIWCERAVELDRVNPHSHFLLGQIFLQQGARDRAVSEMRNAVFLDSGFIMAHVLLGNIYFESNDKNAALRHFRIALQELDKMDQDEQVPFSDSRTAGRLQEMVRLVRDSIG
ncbi:CheR family methyltransferase [Maridesulfovibrio sp.]|uniref:CheR family methyltransferase n=1 Tax=Maridesulfovibrio sp. TaxID=2795000 RepID=UPI0029F48374|nr:CheR family methyltransferase [Maridesulfovibrio sp.]